MKIKFYLSNKIKRRQTPIYSALQDLDVRVPEERNSSDPVRLDAISGHGFPHDGYEPPTSPFGPDIAPIRLIPLGETKIHAAEIESSHDLLPSLPSAIRLSASSHHFNEVPVGDRADWTLFLSNEGGSEGIVSFINGLPSEKFSLVEPPPLPLIIPPEGIQVLTVRYAPDLAGIKSEANLSIGTNDHDFPVYSVLLTGNAINALQELETGFPSLISNSLGMIFRYIPAGALLMGSPEHEPGREDDEVPHEVTLTTGFYLQTTQVTQGQWRTIMGINPSSFQNHGEDCPVEQVSWYESQEFIRRLNVRGEGTYRLPTEAEWEYACRAGNPAALALGDITSLFCEPDPILDESGWYCGNSERRTHPVAQKRPNAYGLFDMHGNVCEWCQDWYGEYAVASEKDPMGPKTGVKRVIRGGSWFSSAKTCRSASRFAWPPKEKAQFIGVRLVRKD
jgi:formylglycine-generating enzyme required for sulfatase activity